VGPARAANPKWLSGMMRHGYKGASEMAATVDYLYAFAATTDAVGDHHFDALYQAFIGNPEVLGFLRDANPAALREMGDKFRRAIERGLWSPRINSAYDRLSALINEPSEAAE
jgi:cobaltochelatase CobN